MTVRVEHGDSREVLKTLADASVDSCVTDPPYSLVSVQKRFGKPGSAPAQEGKDGLYRRASAGFMGKTWDTGETAFDPEFWAEVLRVLKPGAHLIAFSGTRTYHRMACAIEDAGFEIRDQIGWLYGSGFPKSHDVSKGIDRANGQSWKDFAARLRSAREAAGLSPRDVASRLGWQSAASVTDYEDGGHVPPIARQQQLAGLLVEWEAAAARPIIDSAADRDGDGTVYGLAHGGDIRSSAALTEAAIQWQGWGTALKPAWEPICLARKPLTGTVAENVIEHGTGALNIDGCRVTTDENLNGGTYTGNRRVRDCYTPTDSAQGAAPLSRLANGAGEFTQPPGRWPANLILDGSDDVLAAFPETDSGAGNKNAGNREHSVFNGGPLGAGNGLGVGGDSGSAARFFYSAKADAEDRFGSKHPTVKPIDLMAYLCRLVTPPGGTVLDPFAGSGTTGAACLREGFNCILIEREAEYIPDIMARIELASGEGRHPAVIKHRNVDPAKARGEDMPLFAEPSGEAA